MNADRPIGVFDSGIGGLSVLDALCAELPHERFVYFADTAHAPYGERGEAYIVQRSRAVARYLFERHGIKALVVACNTATAAAIHVLRAEHPELPIVGVEPALKPATALTRTRRIAVLATRATLESGKFAALCALLDSQAEFRVVACDGLAGAIERGEIDTVDALCRRYVEAAGPFGHGPDQADTLVLGCTHYPFARADLQRHAGDAVCLVDTGAPVAQQARRLLARGALLATAPDIATHANVTLLASAAPDALTAAAQRWLSRPSGRASLAESSTREAA